MMLAVTPSPALLIAFSRSVKCVHATAGRDGRGRASGGVMVMLSAGKSVVALATAPEE